MPTLKYIGHRRYTNALMCVHNIQLFDKYSALLQALSVDPGASAAVRHSAYIDPAAARLSGLGSLADGV